MLVSNVGTWIQSTAMGLLVYDLTGKATDVGITLLAQFLPMLLLERVGRQHHDRVDKRRMAMITQSVMSARRWCSAWCPWRASSELWVVYAATVLGIASALDNPARQVRGQLVEPADIHNVLALNRRDDRQQDLQSGDRRCARSIRSGPAGCSW
ncbi:MAG: MFS transporter [Ilumatobacteraceae bacterium]